MQTSPRSSRQRTSAEPPLRVPGVIDSHCHLDPKNTGKMGLSAEELLLRAREVGVAGFVVVGVGETSLEARNAIALADEHCDVVAAVGVHPHDARFVTDAMVDEIAALAAHPRVAAVGEIGLDFHYDSSPRDAQRLVLRRFIAVAKSVRKPIVVHTRSAGMEVLSILEDEQAHTLGGIIHCFTEDMAFAKRALDLGFDLSFSGIVTFKTATSIQEVAKWAPADRILLETDSPYLAPVPMRGRTCEPAMIVNTARFVADLRNVDVETLAQTCSNNTRRLVGNLFE